MGVTQWSYQGNVWKPNVVGPKNPIKKGLLPVAHAESVMEGTSFCFVFFTPDLKIGFPICMFLCEILSAEEPVMRHFTLQKLSVSAAHTAGHRLPYKVRVCP